MRYTRRILIAILVLIAAMLAAWIVPVRNDRIWIDSVTGSMKQQTCWFFVCQTSEEKPSAIEHWITQHEGTHKADWRFLSRTSKNLFGNVVSRGCALAPEIDPLHQADLNTSFVHAATDAEVREFVRTMRTGSPRERTRAVELACRKAVESTVPGEPEP